MTDNAPKHATYKRIIICADGTWLTSMTTGDEVPSNIAKLARAVANNGIDEQGNLVKQVVFYQSGLGSGEFPFQKAVSGAIGLGLDSDVCQIYDFISNNYEAGDELFFFGFSRGAFTARSAAGLVCSVGVLSAEHMSRFPEMWNSFRQGTPEEPFQRSEWYRNNQRDLGLSDVRVKVVGVWDTVGALGIPQYPGVNLAIKAGLPINKEFAFHNTNVSKNLDYAFHALAVDEKRFTFPPTMWHATYGAPAKELQQCWFPGRHENIGGQAAAPRSQGDNEEIGDNTFAWMVDNLSGMLTFEESSIKMMIEQHRRALNSIKVENGWGCGPLVDNFSGLQGAFFRLLGRLDRTPGNYKRDPGDGSDGSANETFHPLLRIRKIKVMNYDPPALSGYVLQEPDDKYGWKWVKRGVPPVREYVMHPEKTMSLAYEEDGVVKYRIEKSLSRSLCPKNILFELDRDNGISGVRNGA